MTVVSPARDPHTAETGWSTHCVRTLPGIVRDIGHGARHRVTVLRKNRHDSLQMELTGEKNSEDIFSF